MSTAPSFDIGLALSGGGFRAAAFHLGVLKRLEETGLLPHLRIVSTVSGGSITGALYALRCAQHGDGSPGSYPVDAVIDEVRALVTSNLRGAALLGTPLRAARAALSFVSRRFSRMSLLVDELDRQLFDGAPVSELPPWILINATNLATGKAWKFFHDRAGDYLIGATDKTDHIRVAEAVGASAAHPLLTEPYPFSTRWQDLRADLLDRRWQRPPRSRPGEISRWRHRYGKSSGSLTLPLADGGLYDNEGLNGVRSARVDHAIYASAATPSGDFEGFRGARSLLRMVGVMHSRLGAVTRQHAHEMTHGHDPGDVRRQLGDMADELRQLSSTLEGGRQRLLSLAQRLEVLSAVGTPPRGPQYRSIAPILLHRTDIADNRPAKYDPPYDIPPALRGLQAALVEELSHVRTDLDAHHPTVVDLLMAQAYFLTDAHLKINIPDVLSAVTGTREAREQLLPSWTLAREAVETANANRESTRRLIRDAAERRWLKGRSSLTI